MATTGLEELVRYGRATEQDIDELYRQIQPEVQAGVLLQVSPSEYRTRVEDDRTRVAELNGKIVGQASVEFLLDKAELRTLHVSPELRGLSANGTFRIGEGLIWKIMDIARSDGHETLYAVTVSECVDFFSRAGFRYAPTDDEIARLKSATPGHYKHVVMRNI